MVEHVFRSLTVLKEVQVHRRTRVSHVFRSITSNRVCIFPEFGPENWFRFPWFDSKGCCVGMH